MLLDCVVRYGPVFLWEVNVELADNPIKEEDFDAAKSEFLAGCEKVDGVFRHKKCGGAIRRGFMPCFWVRPDGELDPGSDGFGIGPLPVPYCENCDPPDGFNYAYAIRVGIIPKDEKVVHKPKPISDSDRARARRYSITDQQRR